MVKVLILAYDFPPYVSVGGLRPYSWHKYLLRYGIYPIVVTRQWGNQYGNALDYVAPGYSSEIVVEESECGTILRSPYKPNFANRLLLKYGENRFRLLRRSISAWYEIMQWFFPVGPKYGLYRAADHYLQSNKVDAIIATGDPFILFRYANKLSKKYRIPWIADYRDPWAQKLTNPYLLRVVLSHLERSIVSGAARVTTVSDLLVKLFQTNLKNKKFDIVYNGYDPEVIPSTNHAINRNKVLTIAYAGTIYPWHPWRQILHLLNQFAAENKFNVKVEFYGINIPDEIQKTVYDFSEKGVEINFNSRIPNNILLEELSKADLLLLFNDYSIYGTKIFDYLAIKRPILFCFENDEEALELKNRFFCLPELPEYKQMPQAELIRHTHSGYIVKDSDQLLQLLATLKEEFERNGCLPCSTEGFEFYSRENQAGRLAEIIKSVVNVR